jgi:hypothetical protein
MERRRALVVDGSAERPAIDAYREEEGSREAAAVAAPVFRKLRRE